MSRRPHAQALPRAAPAHRLVRQGARTRWRAAMATPCAWLPAEAQMTPPARASGVRLARKLNAPRTLNEKTCGRPARGSGW